MNDEYGVMVFSSRHDCEERLMNQAEDYERTIRELKAEIARLEFVADGLLAENREQRARVHDLEAQRAWAWSQRR